VSWYKETEKLTGRDKDSYIPRKPLIPGKMNPGGGLIPGKMGPAGLSQKRHSRKHQRGRRTYPAVDSHSYISPYN